MARLSFSGWRRSDVYAAVASPNLTDGRLTGSVDLTLRSTEAPQESVVETLRFDLLGPGDVDGLSTQAVIRVRPAPGTSDAETTICPSVELAAPDLPWRYTPELAAGKRLRPWLVLVVAQADEAELLPGGLVRLAPSALAAHDLAKSPRSAHVQEDAEHPGRPPVTRLLSLRPLESQTAYVAALVPAFGPDGKAAWPAPSAVTQPVTLPAYRSWTFATGEAGDFPTLAGRLHPGAVPTALGQAPLTYSPLPGSDELSVRGALAPIGSADDPVPQAIADDVESLTTPVVAIDRPVVTVPVYGSAWVNDLSAPTWARVFRRDPRSRGVAGLGLETGIREQDLFAEAAAAQMGALAVAASRIRNLTAGLLASRSLWRRRLPADPMRRLAVFGPSLARMMTNTGTVRTRIAGADRVLSSALFSSAGRRALRPGPARTAALGTRAAADPAAVLQKANAPRPDPERAPGGLPHVAHLSRHVRTGDLDDLVVQGVSAPGVRSQRLAELGQRFDRRNLDAETVSSFNRVVGRHVQKLETGGDIPLLPLLSVLDPDGPRPNAAALRRLLAAADAEPDTPSLVQLAAELKTSPLVETVRPVADLPALARRVADAVDPTVAQPFAVRRVLDQITGLGPKPLAPPELEPDLDIPAWQLLRDHAPDWLLPGAGELDADSVIGVSTNPAFVDAFLIGLNTQILGELRFRNIPVISGWTPLRQFWARANAATGSYDDDIRPITEWPEGSNLGSSDHQPSSASSADLVIVFRTPLFRRYPDTLVYLAPAPVTGGKPDWNAEPDFAHRLLPNFQGVISPEITFFGFDLNPDDASGHWVVLEEMPAGYRSYNTLPPDISADRRTAFDTANNGADFAHASFADPFRVMIRGEALVPKRP